MWFTYFLTKKEGDRSHEQPPSCLLGYPDSNQERQDQNLQCYHYTIAQTDFRASLLICGCKSREFL